jgi:hypothetical protein
MICTLFIRSQRFGSIGHIDLALARSLRSGGLLILDLARLWSSGVATPRRFRSVRCSYGCYSATLACVLCFKGTLILPVARVELTLAVENRVAGLIAGGILQLRRVCTVVPGVLSRA